MDSNGFDRVTRKLALPATRRGVLRTGAGLLIGAAALGVSHQAEAGLFGKHVAVIVENNSASFFGAVYVSSYVRYPGNPVPSGGQSSFEGDTNSLEVQMLTSEGASWSYSAYMLNPDVGMPSASVQSAEGGWEIPTTFLEEGQVAYGTNVTIERLSDGDFKWFKFTVS